MPLDPLLGPIVALALIGLLALVLRWTFGGAKEPPAPEDFGLLVPVAVVDRPDSSGVLEALRAAGIRATVSTGPDGRERILVFESDVDSARRVLGPA